MSEEKRSMNREEHTEHRTVHHEVGRLAIAAIAVLAAGLVGVFGLIQLNEGNYLAALAVPGVIGLMAYGFFLVTAPRRKIHE